MRRRGSFYDDQSAWVDTFVPLITVALAIAILQMSGWSADVSGAIKGGRGSLYATYTQVSGSLLGFILAAVSIILNFVQGPRTKLLRESNSFGPLFAVFFQAIALLSVATGWGFIVLFIDTDQSPSLWALYVTMAIAVVTTMRVVRCVIFMKRLTEITVMSAVRPPEGRQVRQGTPGIGRS